MENYVTTYDWMLELGLKGVEINAFAVIFSFWKEGKVFQGSASYLGRWMGVASKKTVRTALSKLVKKGLVEKRERWEKGEKFCDYRPNMSGAKITPGGVTNAPGGGVNFTPHTYRPDSDSDKKEINNKEIHLSVEEFRKQHRT